MGGSAEQAQAGLDLALQLLHLWCAAGKAELALAWISALIADSSGMQRLPAATESRATLGALFEGACPARGAFAVLAMVGSCRYWSCDLQHLTPLRRSVAWS